MLQHRLLASKKTGLQVLLFPLQDMRCLWFLYPRKLVSFTKFKSHKLKPEWPWSFEPDRYSCELCLCHLLALCPWENYCLRALISFSVKWVLKNFFHWIVRIKWIGVKCLGTSSLPSPCCSVSCIFHSCVSLLWSESFLQLCFFFPAMF